ncbi:MAG: KH domain-containing protein [Candidatus Aureabacteria bacterium]|nr:KH domain-containing protein [Candidatus Auribacterota bacterium]
MNERQKLLTTVQQIVGTLAKLILHEDASIIPQFEDETLKVEVESKESALLIGKEGKVLESLQYITQRIAQRNIPEGQIVRIIIDIAGYRTRKEEEISKLAKEIAERVSKSGQSVLMQPMGSWERRIVHMALKDEAKLVTESEDTIKGRQVRIKLKEGGQSSSGNEQPD